LDLAYLAHISIYEKKLLRLSALLSLFFIFIILTAVGSYQHWLAHPQAKTEWASPHYIETEIYQHPEPKFLSEEKKTFKAAPAEKVLSSKPDVGQKKTLTPSEEKNVTKAGPELAPSHGPIVIDSPAPVIPEYLRDQDLSSSVVIDFFITTLGVVSPRLISSSGNEELDALAIATAKRWRFKPAEQNHQAIDSKIRLRINFQVQ
jgi:TonB family protein